MADNGEIIIKGARAHNLKNIDVRIPRNKITVITGLSGSGKSSLAFDTLYAEGQRRYVESLSSYARQFLGRLSKPECDYIKGIPPAIAIEQKVSIRNSRSTVGTSTEIYEYMKLLYARIGKTISPISGNQVKKHQVSDVVDYILSFPVSTKGLILSKIVFSPSDTLPNELKRLQLQGFSRIELNGNVLRISDLQDAELEGADTSSLFLVVDRFVVRNDEDTKGRLADSVQTAFWEGENGSCTIRMYNNDGTTSTADFSNKFEADGMTFDEPNELMFSFNSPYGACPECEGYGKVVGIDENLVVPNKTLSVYDGAVTCWKGEKMGEWLDELIANAKYSHFPIHKPYNELSKEEHDMLWNGTNHFHGINDFFEFVKGNQYKIQYRIMLARFRGRTDCPVCKGTRLKPEANYVKVGGKSISELVDLPVDKLQDFFNNLVLTDDEFGVAKRLLIEIKNRLQFLKDVGLSYLTMNRLSNSLSGGESQRINLATSLGSSLVGSLYILDEPSIGLHPRDSHQLISVLRKLQKLGNTVVIVEHDEEIMRAADYLIDIGPEAGRLGGEVVFAGTIEDGLKQPDKRQKSHTFQYLCGDDEVQLPRIRRPWSNFIEVEGACENNLKNINVKFPLNVITVVTGVSGSGKSSLVSDVFYNALKRYYGDSTPNLPGAHSKLSGDLKLIKNVEFVDQSPIGKSARANPVTYIKAYDEIRKLYANQPYAKQMGYTPAHFSFNVEGGRCEECQGEGSITVEMQFMADLVLTCDACHGQRFRQDVLEVKYKGKSIFDVLDMTINQAMEFFSEGTSTTEKNIIKRMKPLQDVGLGYVKLGQPSSTLSGGESQRVKLASILAGDKSEPTMFIFDEPTTGLHIHDVKTLLKSFNALVDAGHTIVIIEHNLDVIKCADHVIDIGPEGGAKGGELVFTGTPEELIKEKRSYTAKFLADKLK